MALAHRRFELDEHRRINGCASIMLSTTGAALMPFVAVLVVVTETGGGAGTALSMALLVLGTITFLLFCLDRAAGPWIVGAGPGLILPR